MDTLFYKMCRLCASEEPKVSVNMFSEIGKRHQLPDKIRLCLPITVDEDDRLPKEICTSCLYKLDICNDLYHESFTAQNILKSKLQNILYEQSQYSEETRTNSVSCKSSKEFNAKLPSKTPSNKQTIIKKQSDYSEFEEKDILMRLEPPNSSVVLQDVSVRLTSVNNYSLDQSSISDVFAYEKPVIPGIIVTDISGAPLVSYPGVNEFETPPPPDEDVMDLTEEECTEPNSSTRLADNRNKGGGGGGKNSGSPIETNNRKEQKSKEKSAPTAKLKHFRPTKKKLDEDNDGEREGSSVEINGEKAPPREKSELRDKLKIFRPSKKKVRVFSCGKDITFVVNLIELLTNLY